MRPQLGSPLGDKKLPRYFCTGYVSVYVCVCVHAPVCVHVHACVCIERQPFLSHSLGPQKPNLT